MRNILAVAACLLVSSPLHAQMAGPSPGAYTGFLQDRGNQAIVESYLNPFPRYESDEKREARLQKAIALRAEAQQLLLANGGTMSRQNQTYIRRKANKILNE